MILGTPAKRIWGQRPQIRLCNKQNKAKMKKYRDNGKMKMSPNLGTVWGHWGHPGDTQMSPKLALNYLSINILSILGTLGTGGTYIFIFIRI